MQKLGKHFQLLSKNNLGCKCASRSAHLANYISDFFCLFFFFLEKFWERNSWHNSTGNILVSSQSAFEAKNSSQSVPRCSGWWSPPCVGQKSELTLALRDVFSPEFSFEYLQPQYLRPVNCLGEPWSSDTAAVPHGGWWNQLGMELLGGYIYIKVENAYAAN